MRAWHSRPQGMHGTSPVSQCRATARVRTGPRSAPLLGPHRGGSGAARPRTWGWGAPPCACPTKPQLVLVSCALQNMPPVRSSVWDYVAPRCRKGRNRPCASLNVTNSPSETRQCLEIFSLHRPVPFHKALIAGEKELIHLHEAWKCSVQSLIRSSAVCDAPPCRGGTNRRGLQTRRPRGKTNTSRASREQAARWRGKHHVCVHVPCEPLCAGN